MGTAIVVTSGKGGTGKTSITGGVAGSLARLGHSVLCIDMDIGLRNLDISLGLSDRALMDFSDVAEGRCPLVRAAVNHPDLPGLALLTAPMTLSSALTEEAVRRMLDTARSLYDYVLIDSPAGLGAGFRMACCGADRAIVVSTNDASSLRDAQRTVGELDFLRQIHLLGVVPEDPQVMLSANLGRPLILGGRQGAANACLNIAKRLEGRRVPIMRIR